jgi:uncharacterized protein (DUF885 family)
VANADSFDRLLQDYYHAWFRFHPLEAVEAGVSGFETQLPPHDDDDIRALVGLNEMLLASLDEIDFAALNADQQIDYRLAYGSALSENLELREADWRYHNPTRFIPIEAIHQLFMRPVENLAEAFEARLGQMPDYLRDARIYLDETPEVVPQLWVESAITEARAGIGYLRSLERNPRLEGVRDLHGLIERAAHALDDFANYLETTVSHVAEGSFACGQEHFERILKYRHFLDVSADELHAFGVQLFDETLMRMRSVCRQLTGHEDVHVLLEQIQADQPPRDGLLDYYRERMLAARRFLEERDLVPLPETERLKVIETPAYLRHQIPFAAYMQPAPNDPEQRGYYYVTPVDDEALMAEHNRLSIDHTCVHEAWPGHHLQFVTANSRFVSRSLPRVLSPSATYYEGWALYCEELMVEEGFLDQPESRFLLLRDRLWRALRIQLDVELHCRELGLDEAVDRMVEALGFPAEQAMADITWYSFAPGVPMGYATGWAMIRLMREQLEAQDQLESLTEFHRDLLASGAIALPLALANAFGTERWAAVREALFEEQRLPR